MVCSNFVLCHKEQKKRKNCNNCLKVTTDSLPTVREGGTSYTLKNSNRIQILSFHVDNGLIDGNEEIRCDYLLMVPKPLKAFFIELKSGGEGWKKAVAQLENTLKLLYPFMTEYTPNLRAVVRRSVPKTNYNELSKRRKAIITKYPGASLEVSTRFADEV